MLPILELSLVRSIFQLAKKDPEFDSRRLGDVHLDVGQGLGSEDVLEEPLRPHAALGLLGQAGHGLDALDGKKQRRR